MVAVWFVIRPRLRRRLACRGWRICRRFCGIFRRVQDPAPWILESPPGSLECSGIQHQFPQPWEPRSSVVITQGVRPNAYVAQLPVPFGHAGGTLSDRSRAVSSKDNNPLKKSIYCDLLHSANTSFSS